MSGLSNSVRVQFSGDHCPASFGAAHALLSVYGDIARLDVTFVSSTGFVIATYFDVRAAERVLADHRPYSESFPATAHDFRAVTVSAEAVMSLSSSFGGFPSFGEVMAVSLEGEDMVVEYFDMRAAQAVLLGLPTSKPRSQVGGGEEAAAHLLPMLQHNGEARSESSFGGSSPFGSESPAGTWSYGNGTNVSRSESSTDEPAWEPTTARIGSGTISAGIAATVDRAGKPVRAKAAVKDFAKFDIQAAKITSGEDTRTTVMMRNIPKTCSRDDVADLLEKSGLQDRYTFFYMPFDKRRNHPCGFAFLNFHSPADVLQLHVSSQTSLWRALAIGTHTMPPAVSYARLQGHEELVKHFSLSAITNDKDIRKRPQFMHGDDGGQARHLAGHANTKAIPSIDRSIDMEPRYILNVGLASVPSCVPACVPARIRDEDMEWLQSSAAGA